MAVTLAAFIAEVEKFKNSPYLWGGASPAGFDCSGLVQYSLQQLGVKNVPRVSQDQYKWAQKITKDQLQPGDLVFANFPGESPSPGHVGIYIGNGNVYSARGTASGIGIDSLASWGSAIVGYGRIPGIDATASSSAASTTTGGGSDILGWLTGSTGFLSDFKDLFTIFHNLISPSFWLRIGAFFIGSALLIFGIYALVKANGDGPLMPQGPVPVPV
jgi:hypothetical protein